MSTPPPVLDPFQQQPPPMVMTQQQAYTAHSGHGTVGPFIGVLAVIAILGAIAVMIGRLCSGRGIMGHGHYDFESWVETKCSSCIDGRVETPMPRRVVENSSSNSVPGEAPPPAAAAASGAAPEEANPEAKEHEDEDENEEEEEEEAASSDHPGHHPPHERVES